MAPQKTKTTENTTQKRLRAGLLIQGLDRLYSATDCSIDHDGPLQLLISTQLAAQCTDARVNQVTKQLYKKYRNVRDFAEADIAEFEDDIRSTGFYHNKARNIIGCCRMLITDYGGEVPQTLEELLKLPGVGRKTANLVLGDAFGIPGIVIDTHAKRLAKRMGLTTQENPEKIEYDLMKLIPKENWIRFCHQLVLHGRAVCSARKASCGACQLSPDCPKINTE